MTAATSGKATPGPWTCSWSAAGMWLIKCGDYIDPRTDCSTLHDTHFGPDREADARLIAAAPDLLDAVRTMIEWDDAENNAEAWEKDHGAAWRQRLALCALAFTKARAAITKATP